MNDKKSREEVIKAARVLLERVGRMGIQLLMDSAIIRHMSEIGAGEHKCPTCGVTNGLQFLRFVDEDYGYSGSRQIDGALIGDAFYTDWPLLMQCYCKNCFAETKFVITDERRNALHETFVLVLNAGLELPTGHEGTGSDKEEESDA